MDEAADDLKQDPLNDCESLQIHVEVHQKPNSTVKKEDIKGSILRLLNRHNIVFGDYKWTEFDDTFLTNNVQSVAVVDTELKLKERQPIYLSDCNLFIHIFHLNEEGPSTENLEEENENIIAANHWVLPAAEFHGLWESLVYEHEVKSDLLDYVTTTLLFSDRNVNSNLISWNRVVLLHGPPGTGKTSLCKALAQKLTIRLSHSGKLVTKMFQKIHEFIDDKDTLVFVLIDEVESLTAARNSFRAGTEPSDAIRVVNAVLTQIDQIKRFPNVVILTTSNITEKIDMAFVDRADIKQYIGPPSTAAIFKIYLSCLEELMKCQIIYPRQQLLTLRELEVIGYVENDVSKLSLVLKEIARKSEGLSGRVLRKLPFLAHALYVQTPNVAMAAFLQALSLVVDKQFEERAKLSDCV
ncbi:PREDICTED: pachytene checkpoint protein 2 homolog [Gekko japonicus]|uniref:Pachytene checkpoint protein 2 homolog n=1 Tax=Gekko japonicus TaxID=146911 RepID=A0ABM1KHM0_GEKJA|nr:PREDICTED: pachytene checkpoint protein 2 homolog [Gekko japonicus]